jgi:hypothetical protein
MRPHAPGWPPPALWGAGGCPILLLVHETYGVDDALEHVEHARQAHGGDHGGTLWTRWVALTIAALAVLSALAGLLESRASTEALLSSNRAVLAQAQASDLWAFYQAEGIKRHSFELARDAVPPGSGAVAKAEGYAASIAKYQRTQAAVSKDARAKERERDALLSESNRFIRLHDRRGLALTVLQIGIVLSSAAVLVGRRELWYAGMGAGAAGSFILALALG